MTTSDLVTGYFLKINKMKSVLDVEVSCFKSYSDRIPKPVNLLVWLNSKKYAKQILELRNTKDKAIRNKIKASLPAVTISGQFEPTRKEDNLIHHSKLICIDIDYKGNEEVVNFKDLKQELFKIKNVAYIGLSASGNGYFLILPITYPKRHKQHFLALKNDLEGYGLKIDSAPQNVASLRGYSSDPDALFRHDAIPYRKWGKPKKLTPAKVAKGHYYPSFKDYTSTKDEVEAIIQQIVTQRIDITTHEPDWFRIACALANEFGEEGREYFHVLSQYHPRYNWEQTKSEIFSCT